MADGALVNTSISSLKFGHQSREYLVGAELARGTLPTSAFLNCLPVYLSAPITATRARAADSSLAKLACL